MQTERNSEIKVSRRYDAPAERDGRENAQPPSGGAPWSDEGAEGGTYGGGAERPKAATVAERVFDAWLDPAIARKWLFVTDDGEIVRCDLDARVGGRWTIVRRGPSPVPPNEVIDIEHTGEYLEIDRPRTLAFTFGVLRFSPDMSTVTIDIAPDGDACILSLTATGVPEEWRERTEQGWQMILDRLAEVC